MSGVPPLKVSWALTWLGTVAGIVFSTVMMGSGLAVIESYANAMCWDIRVVAGQVDLGVERAAVGVDRGIVTGELGADRSCWLGASEVAQEALVPPPEPPAATLVLREPEIVRVRQCLGVGVCNRQRHGSW